ncbi:MAG: GntR family transcriptional regulator [Ruminococcaceae bacterium]|nr:GntR family transcriptional regulator [Oscillospiraceae bacterium]
MIKHNASKPLYLQVKENLEESIRSGKYPEGAKLPSEKTLCDEFKVSRITIRQALDLLEAKGMTYSVHGKGTFVKASIIDSNLQKISSFGETLEKMGYTGYTKIASYEERQADDFERMLRGQEWNRISQLSLTGYSMDEPVVLYRSVIRSPYGAQMYQAALDMEREGIPFSTFDLYAKIGLSIGSINQQVAAVNADQEIAELLKLKPGDAVLVLDSVIMDQNKQPIEYKKGYYCTDKYAFNLNREL